MNFANLIQNYDSRFHMSSFDVVSLFTNIPLEETIDIIINIIFSDEDETFHGLTKSDMEILLKLAVIDVPFVFNKQYYMQKDGMAMGSPLGPYFANRLMSYLEKLFLEKCPASFKPILYKRYMDDTFVLFKNKDQSSKFLNYINEFHPNIKFTIENEENNCLPFLDILVERNPQFPKFITSIYRKKTFTGLSLNFYSFCDTKFKKNACSTLLHRAYKICSNYNLFNEEVEFLRKHFKGNNYPTNTFDKIVYKYLDKIYKPSETISTVPKQIKYFSFPYIGSLSKNMTKELNIMLRKHLPSVEFKFVYINPLKIGSLFKYKDILNSNLRSSVIYKFNCPICKVGTYIGSTKRLLKVRIDEHRGVSPRTGENLKVKSNSSIRDHTNKCHVNINYENFEILKQCQNYQDLLINESLMIKQDSPSINMDQSSYPLFIS
jgi:hypothetical protein